MLKFIRAFTRAKNISPIDIREDEIEKELFNLERGTHLLLGKFTEIDIYEALERAGIMDELQKKGLYPVEISIDHESILKQKIFIDLKGESPSPKRIGEVIIGECRYKLNEKVMAVPLKKKEIDSIVVEWLVLQNVKSAFTEEFPRLPGQRYPGLRVGKLVLKLLEGLARATNKECFIAFPEFYHNAVMYIDYLHFLNPETEGRVLKMRDDLKSLPLADVSFAFCGGCIIERRNSEERRISWEAEEMIYPLSEELKFYFSSPEYKAIKEKTYNSHSYQFDKLCYEMKQEELMTKF
jgi:hypothetical protein